MDDEAGDSNWTGPVCDSPKRSVAPSADGMFAA